MKRNFVIIYLAYISILNLSCNKNWLDAKTNQSLTVPSTLTDFQALLDNDAIMNSNGVALGEIASDGHHIIENAEVNLTTFPGEFNSYTWTDSLPNLKIQDWINAYQRIFTCNVVLDGLVKINPGSDNDRSNWNNIKGEALFQRAISFWELSQIYSPQYDTSSLQNFGIPLRLSSDITIPSVRSTLKQTYSQIVSDLILSSTLLPKFPLVKTRASKPSSFGLLARAFLNMGDYQNAKVYSDSCINLFSTLLNFNTLDTTANFVGIFNSEVIFHNRMQTYFSIYGSYLRIDSSLFNLFDTNDLRRSVFFKIQFDSSIEWSGNYDNQNQNLFSGIAVDEMYLIRAECEARQGNISASMNDLNTLLMTRWRTNTFVALTSANVDEALLLIISERRKELLLRGLRWSDLRRLNLEGKYESSLTREVNGKTYFLSPNSYKYNLPIPDDIIQETGMPQNAGWSR